jgi:hypothetical protein
MAQNARERARSLLPPLKMTLPTKGMGTEAKREAEVREKVSGRGINGSAS